MKKNPNPPSKSAATIALFFGACGSLLAAAADKPSRPNVIFIMPDQWRAAALGFAGDPNVRTPNLDRLAQESINCINAVSGMPVCCPARATLMTGQRPLTHGVFINDVPLDPDAATLGKSFRAAGYDTAYIGKWHLDGHGRTNFIPRERRHGFDYWKVMECTHEYNNSHYYADGPEKLKWPGYDAIAQTRDAEDYLRARSENRGQNHSETRGETHGQNPDKPFFLFLSWGPPHSPYHTAPEKFRALYTPEKITLPPNVPERLAAQMRRTLAGYYAHCTALDECVGALRVTLEKTGLARDTLIVFTSDHGDMLGAHGGQAKQQPYDESIRVPLLLHWPAGFGDKPRSTDAPIATEDIMPTLLSLCGIGIPKSVEGLDYAAHLRDGAPPPGDAALISCVTPFGQWNRDKGGREFRGIRTPRHTYVRALNGPWLLFDNQQDPWQLDNLVNKPEAAALQSELDAKLNKKLAAARDEFLPGDAYAKKVAAPMTRAEIESGLKSHDRPLFLTNAWIRDPYIIRGPDDYYYLTGSVPAENDIREKTDPYNSGLGQDSIIGSGARLWRSKDLVGWEYLGNIFKLERDGIRTPPGKRLWAPELHWIGDRWALVHCPKNKASFALSAGKTPKGPWTHPLGDKLGGDKHDPSLFKDGDTLWMLWENTFMAPLNKDMTDFAAKPVRIDPAGSRTNKQGKTTSVIGHEGAGILKIGERYVYFGTAWSTDQMRRGSYNLYYCTADKITGPYGPRRFLGRFLGHGIPFQTRDGKWWCTAFYNANVPPLPSEGIEKRDLSADAQTINQRGATIVPLDVKILPDGDVRMRAIPSAYATPGPDEVQKFTD